MTEYYRIRKSTLRDIVIGTTFLGALVASAVGINNADKRNGGIYKEPIRLPVFETIFDSNHDGNPDYVRVNMAIPARGFSFTYNREPTLEEIAYFKKHYKKN
ncbi:hypothetical protein HY498_05295 [Candidatus Woesearchaeota archaeon]|nr:hypothetical protein [Candidatus Woesearchaeota archaeon]